MGNAHGTHRDRICGRVYSSNTSLPVVVTRQPEPKDEWVTKTFNQMTED